MKSVLTISICIALSIVFIHCTNSQQHGSYVNNKEEDSTFTLFLNKIDNFKLPFEITMGSDSVADFVETVYGNGKYKPNKKFNIISQNEYKFLKDK